MSNSTVNFTSASTNSTHVHEVTTLEMCLFSFNVLFGFPTHFYVIWLIITGTGNGITSEFFFLNLTVCEILICLDCLLFVLSKCFLGLMLLALFLQGLIVTGRPLFQCLICFERYLAVIHPVTFLKYKPLRYRAISCAVSWLFCLGSCFFCFFTLLLSRIMAHACFFSVLFLFFLSIQLFCCVAVLRALKQSGPGERGREREEENHTKRRAFQLILVTTVTTVIMYSPMSASGLYTAVTQTYLREFWILALFSYVLGGFLLPFLYLYRCGKLFCFAPS